MCTTPNQRIRIFNTWSSCVSLPLVNSNTMFTYISSLAWVLTAQSFHDEYGQRCQVYGLVSTTITSIMFIIAFYMKSRCDLALCFHSATVVCSGVWDYSKTYDRIGGYSNLSLTHKSSIISVLNYCHKEQSPA